MSEDFTGMCGSGIRGATAAAVSAVASVVDGGGRPPIADRVRDELMAAERRAVARRFACISHAELVARLGAQTYYRNRASRGVIGEDQWLTTVGLVRELERETEVRLKAGAERRGRISVDRER